MAWKLRPVILVLVSYTKYAVDKVIWRVSLPSTWSEPIRFSSINLSHELGSSLISHRDAVPLHLSENLNRVAWVKAITMLCSLNSCSKILSDDKSAVSLFTSGEEDWSQMMTCCIIIANVLLPPMKGLCWQLCSPALRSSHTCWGEAEGTCRLLIVSFSRKWRRTVEGSSIKQFHRTCWATALTGREKGNQVRTVSWRSHELVYLNETFLVFFLPLSYFILKYYTYFIPKTPFDALEFLVTSAVIPVITITHLP